MKKAYRIFVALILTAAALVSCSKGDDAILRVEKSYLSQKVSAIGGELTIPVRATGEYSATVPSEAASWCRASVDGVILTVTVDPLSDGSSREADITVTSKGCKDVTIHISQSSVMVEDAPSAISLSNGLLAFSVKITSGVPVTFSYPDWITPVDDEWVSGTKTYTFTASKIEDTDTRSGKFVIIASDAGYRLEIPVTQVKYTNAAVKTLVNLWNENMFQSSPLATTSTRYSLLASIEGYCKDFDRDPFQTYLKLNDENAAQYEKDYAILACYRYAFDRVLSDIQTTKVENGTAVIWMLYNMGFIVKTPSACFGMDINHRYASQLAPYLDFICVSHNDTDHIDTNLMTAMNNAGKPILSNFYSSNAYCSTEAKTWHIGEITISTCITDESATDLNCTTIHRIKCGEDAGGFEIIHTGDSSYDRSQFTACLDGSSTNVLILRFGQEAEKNILGSLAGQCKPDYILFSHLEELRHYNSISPMRATILGSISNMSRFEGTVGEGHIYVPFWGEKMLWSDGKLTDVSKE